MSVPDRVQSVYNSALAKLQRMDALLSCCIEDYDNDDFHAWAKHLDSLRRELCTKMKGDENSKIKNMIEQVLIETVKVNMLQANGKRIRIRQETINMLGMIEEELRHIHRKAGYEGKEKDSGAIVGQSE